MKYFKDNNFIVISDDIGWCKENIKGENVYYSHYEDEVFDLSVIKNCDNNIALQQPNGIIRTKNILY